MEHIGNPPLQHHYVRDVFVVIFGVICFLVLVHDRISLFLGKCHSLSWSSS